MNEIITDNNSCGEVSELEPGTLFQCDSGLGRFFIKTEAGQAVNLETVVSTAPGRFSVKITET